MAYEKQKFESGGVLYASQLNAMDDQIAINANKEVPTKTSQLTNDSGFLTQHQSLSGYAKTANHYTKTESDGKYQPKGDYLTSFTESDPTVPSWAKATSKPSYTKSEVGLGNVDNVKQYSTSNPPPYPVTSVNSRTGAVSLTASDVGALASAYHTSKTLTVTYEDGTTETVNLVVQK